MENMSAAWLKQLAPAHAPPPPGCWPLAPGWWILMLLLILIVATLMYRYRRPARVLRRIALSELQHLENSAVDDAQLARELQNLLRRYALAAYGRAAVASLSGQQWLMFVATHGGNALSGETGENFLRSAYGGQARAERERWLSGVNAFLRWRK